MARYEPYRTTGGKIRRILTRYMEVVCKVDDDWYRVVNANGKSSPGFCKESPKLLEGYVTIRDWTRGCEWANVYYKVDD